MHLKHTPFMILVGTMLLLGMWAGLLRVGWNLPTLYADFALAHGVLMVGGFLGTLISLERAVALNMFFHDRPYALLPYSVPILSGLGALALVFDLSVVALLMSFSSVGMVMIFGYIIRKQPANFTLTMGLGAVCWLVGNLNWLAGQPLFMSAPWWATFVIFTIAGERLELSRLMRHAPYTKRLFMGLVVLMLVGLLIAQRDTPRAYDIGMRIVGVANVGLALWLLRYDIVRRTIKQTGLPRYIAACLGLGYVWLGVAGILAIGYGGVKAGMVYDAILHSIFLGFAFSMIFGHGPIILPAIMNLSIRYSPAFYGHLALLHLSLVLRVGGDLAVWQQGRQWGALLNVVVLLVFVANTLRTLHTHDDQPVLPRGRWSYAAYLGAVPLMAAGVVLVIAGAVMSTRPDAPSASTSGDTAHGQRLYQSSCASCHGTDLRGINGVGKDLLDNDFVASQSDQELVAFILEGRTLFDPQNTTGLPMPARGGNPALSDDDILAIVQYIRQKAGS